MDVLNNLRDFLNVKTVSVIGGEVIPANLKKANAGAGADLLSHFHQQWQEMHQQNEDNAQLVARAALLVENIHKHVTTQNEDISKINHFLSMTPSLKSTIETCNVQIQQLCKSFEEIESALVNYEDLIEQHELDQKKNNHRYQLALYEEKKLANLEQLRAELSAKHSEAVIESEIRKKQTLQERQQVFQDAFRTDLETYKTFGTIPKIQVRNQTSALLEEIQLDIDDKELMDFLDE